MLTIPIRIVRALGLPLGLATACMGDPTSSETIPDPREPSAASLSDPVLVGAGDIGDCKSGDDEISMLAYWHHAVFSSGKHGPYSPKMAKLWRILDEAGVDVVLAAHDHLYERFAPQDADGRADPNGIRQFVVGTGGGESLYPIQASPPNLQVRDNKTRGVLKLTLHPAGFDWEFVPQPGKSFRDAGSAACVETSSGSP